MGPTGKRMLNMVAVADNRSLRWMEGSEGAGAKQGVKTWALSKGSWCKQGRDEERVSLAWPKVSCLAVRARVSAAARKHRATVAQVKQAGCDRRVGARARAVGQGL